MRSTVVEEAEGASRITQLSPEPEEKVTDQQSITPRPMTNHAQNSSKSLVLQWEINT